MSHGATRTALSAFRRLTFPEEASVSTRRASPLRTSHTGVGTADPSARKVVREMYLARLSVSRRVASMDYIYQI